MLTKHTYGEIEINERALLRQLVIYSEGKRVCSVMVKDDWQRCELLDMKGAYNLEVRKAIKDCLQMMGYQSAYYMREKRGEFIRCEVFK